jgi:hypothetical protein
MIHVNKKNTNNTSNVRVNVIFRRLCVTTSVVSIAICIPHSDRVSVALVIQTAKRMRHIILPFVACPNLPNVSTLSHKRHDFRKKVFNIKCIL